MKDAVQNCKGQLQYLWLFFICVFVHAGKSGTYIGPYYIGPFISNLFNTGSQQPLNKWTNDSAACTRMYDETVRIIHESQAGLKTSAL